jgi:acyl-coenzyme A synthetase/AMP-(fatty) acid ligase
MYWSAMSARAGEFAGLPALRAGEARFTYAALFGTVEALAQRLAPRVAASPADLPARCRITVSSQLGIALGMLVAMRLGLSPLATRTGASGAQIDAIDETIAPVLVIADADLDPLPAPAAEWDTTARLGPRDELFMIMTSGTTGTPRIAARPAESLLITAAANTAMMGFAPGERVACHLSLSYAYGLGTLFFGALWGGAELLLFEARQTPRQVIRAVAESRTTILAAPPSLHRLYLEARGGSRLDAVRLVAFAGEPFTPALLEELQRAYPNARLLNHLGITEAGATIAHIDLPDPRAAAGCIGRPMAFVRYRLEGVADEAAGEPGRLLLAGPAVFLGYVRPGGGYTGLDAEGWFATGDLVSRDAEGLLYHHGRIDRQFKSMGRMISPDAIERAIRLGVPGVADVVCRAEPDDLAGHVPVVQVQPVAGATLDAATVCGACARALDGSHVPERVEFVAGFEVAASGKRRV